MKIMHEKEAQLLTRDQFRERCLQRDQHRCVHCGRTDRPLDVHHIIERRLFRQGGYFVENGVSLCDHRSEGCHTLAEQTLISPETLRQQASIQVTMLPDDLYDDVTYTKWGDIQHPDGSRSPGPLFEDESVQRILKEGGVLEHYTKHVAYPRTWHLLLSEGATKDDQKHDNYQHLVGHELIATIKLDGQNITLYDDGLHGRSVHGHSHPSQHRVRALQPSLMLDPDLRLVVENLYARHTIGYQNLPGFEMVISFWRGQECLSWEETELYARILSLPTVPTIWQGSFETELEAQKTISSLLEQMRTQGHEGLVIRRASSFRMTEFARSVNKALTREFAHLRDSKTHDWKRQAIIPNQMGTGEILPVWE